MSYVALPPVDPSLVQSLPSVSSIINAINGSDPNSTTTTSGAASDVPEGPSGATAQTGGFVSAASPEVALSHSQPPPDVSGWGGGLGSSPNVPRPGTSIDPATGKPHVAGLTRAELEAKRAAAAATVETATAGGVVEGNGSGKGKEKDISELSGREQAARQLAGTQATAGTAQDIRSGSACELIYTEFVGVEPTS
jgi:hypothetical protein